MGWSELLTNPERFNGQRVLLEGEIVGSLIETFGSDHGVQTSISPHPTRSRMHPMVDDMEARVLVFLPTCAS